jgi:YggT family protein
MWIQGYLGHVFPLPGLLILAAVKLFKISLYLLMGAVFAQVILSWVNPHTPVASVLDVITRRFLLPLRRIVPMLGSVDLTPMLLLIICQLIIIVPIVMLERVALSLF